MGHIRTHVGHTRTHKLNPDLNHLNPMYAGDCMYFLIKGQVEVVLDEYNGVFAQLSEVLI